MVFTKMDDQLVEARSAQFAMGEIKMLEVNHHVHSWAEKAALLLQEISALMIIINNGLIHL